VLSVEAGGRGDTDLAGAVIQSNFRCRGKAAGLVWRTVA
jgi:hypothetical protein